MPDFLITGVATDEVMNLMNALAASACAAPRWRAPENTVVS
jgi:hypothetical protein